MTSQPGSRTFTLAEASQLLPGVKGLTAQAADRVQRLAAQAQGLADSDPARESLDAEIHQTIRRWAEAVQALGLEAKGLWLVDFDNGDGYYCWCHPEEAITHFHGYDEGFAGRMKIV